MNTPKAPRRSPGHYPPGCGCGARWGGSLACHCAACHRTFGGIGLFDLHRRGACLDPAGLRTKDGDPLMRLDGGIWRNFERLDVAVFGATKQPGPKGITPGEKDLGPETQSGRKRGQA